MGYDAVWDSPREECGVFGICDPGVDIPLSVYYGLFALQHRGQESAGMTLAGGVRMVTQAGMGLVTEVFRTLPQAPGHIGLGHVRYSTTGASMACNIQPIVAETAVGEIALAHNGNLINTASLREEQIAQGMTFRTTMDTEVILNLIARSAASTAEERIREAAQQIDGAFCLVIATQDKLFGLRDPQGYRPLCLGATETGWVLASETCALDSVGAKFVRDIEPGQMVCIDANGPTFSRFANPATSRRKARCSFEYVYFARPDSVFDGESVYDARLRMGAELWRESQFDGDLVMSVPDSGNVAAIGYARASGIPYAEGLIKNRYMGRTFIQPTQAMRERSVRMKLNPVVNNVAGKRLVLIDDSIVRGTTSGIIIDLLRQAGAKEISLCISSPPVMHPCYFGIDTSERNELIAVTHSVEEIRRFVRADRLHYLSQEGLQRAIRGIPQEEICFACFDGDYRGPIPEKEEA
ncbi:MAG: amidophosphoribosyltransferase [Veillonellaceae bacterium]|nr:amidophosphoribosyltransferase [Veillonellaceae bacterium]